MKQIKHALIASVIAVTATAQAEERQNDPITDAKQGATFLGTAAAGAALGGPLGFIGGALLGYYFAETIEAADREDSMSLQLATVNRDLGEVQDQLSDARYTISIQQDHIESSMVALQEALSVDLLFSFNDAELSDRDIARINRVASVLNEYPNLTMTIHGFADHRGDENYNQSLSAKRAERVAQAFIDSGIDEERIFTEARGEVALAEDVSSRELAQSRRVSVAIELNDLAVAQN